jgi:lipopolysaccharide transport system ATP-binding protein
LGAGFDGNLSGRENIFLNGALLGYSKKYMEEHFKEIVDFAELDNFIEVPVKNYSSGMRARLGFSIATAVHADILIVDEVLSVGDYTFRKKCEQKIADMLLNGTTLLYVSHSIDSVKKLCKKTLWLDEGRIIQIGDTEKICDTYLHNNKKQEAK